MTEYSKILVPTDFSDCSVEAFDAAARMAEQFQAEVVLLHVTEPAFDYSRYGLHETVIEARRKEIRNVIDDGLAAMHKRLPWDRVRVEVKEGRPADTICSLAKDEGFDLIVMSTHGFTGVRHLMMGSTAERVVRHAECAVLTVRAKGT